MGAFVCIVCIAVASFAVLAQPAVAQAAEPETTLPLTYPNRVLQRDGSQICPSEEQRGMARNEVKDATRSLLRESAIPLLQLPNNFSYGGSTGWRRVGAVTYIYLHTHMHLCYTNAHKHLYRDDKISSSYPH